MADSYGLSTKGWWLAHADETLASMLQFESRVPASESYTIAGSIDQVTTDSTDVIGITKEAVVVVKASFAVNEVDVADAYSLANAGTSGAEGLMLAERTAADTLTAYRPYTLTLEDTVNVPAGAALVFVRTTVGAAATCQAGQVTVEVAPDITSQSALVGVAPAAITIAKVTFVPDTTYVSGAISLLNKGTAGTDSYVVASKAAATLTAGVPYTLTLSTIMTTLRYTDNQIIALSRATAGGDKTMPGGRVIVEADLTHA